MWEYVYKCNIICAFLLAARFLTIVNKTYLVYIYISEKYYEGC